MVGLQCPSDAVSGAIRGNRGRGSRIIKEGEGVRNGRGGEQSRDRVKAEHLQVVAHSSEVDIVIPEGRHPPHSTHRAGQILNNLAVVIGVELAHTIAVGEVNGSLFSYLHE